MNLKTGSTHAVAHRARLLAITLAIGTVASPCFAAKHLVRAEALEGGYQVVVPATTHVAISDPAEDFVVYTFSNEADGKFLTIYMGNQPHDIPTGTAHLLVRKSTLAGYQTKMVKWRDVKGGHCGNVSVALGAGWPQIARFSYLGVTAKQEVAIEKIVDSFSVANKKLRSHD
jgi:hypothetical protein